MSARVSARTVLLVTVCALALVLVLSVVQLVTWVHNQDKGLYCLDTNPSFTAVDAK